LLFSVLAIGIRTAFAKTRKEQGNEDQDELKGWYNDSKEMAACELAIGPKGYGHCDGWIKKCVKGNEDRRRFTGDF
jgi:hypothetical protein